MVRRNRAVLLGNNLPQLQNMIKRDPQSYEEEFLQQYRHFESSLSLFELKPSEENKDFCDQATFLAQVVKLYPEQAKVFPGKIMDLLSRFHMLMEPDLRKHLVQALILLKNKGVISSIDLLSLFFTLFRCPDKLLRVIIYTFIVNDIKTANAKIKNNRLNQTLQNYLFTILNKTREESAGGKASQANPESIIAAKKSLQVCIELYQKNVWNDRKTVNIIADSCLSPISKISVIAAVFFLGANEKKEDEDSDDDILDLKKLDHQTHINKKTKSRARKRDKAIASIKKRAAKGKKAEVFNFSALHLINDPQGFVEKLFSRLHKANTENFEVKLVLMKLIARVVGIHKLLLLGFYPLLIRYLQPHQRDVTQILALTAQACHELVPPDALEPIIMAIANNFVNDTNANEVISVGINSIREICARAPLAITPSLVEDLTEYKKNRDKSVVMASRSLIQLFREIDPTMLKKKDRGREATMAGIQGAAPKPLKFGEVRTVDSIAGTEYLDPEYKSPGDSDNDDGTLCGDSDGKNKDINQDSDNDEDGSEIEEDEDEEEEEDCEFSEGEEEESSIQEVVTKPDSNSQTKIKSDKPRVETLRILTDEDYKLIKKRLKQSELEKIAPSAGVKRKAVSLDTDSESESGSDGDPEIVDESAIVRFRKKAKQDYQERLASIQSGREGRAKFGSSVSKKTDKHSTSNLQKKRTKNFKMMTHKTSVRLKSKMSLRDKQLKLRSSINKQKKRKH